MSATKTRGPGSLNPTKAKQQLRKKAGTLEGMYYAVGVEVPPRRRSTFSMRYVEVPSALAGVRMLRAKLARKRKGMTGHVIVAIAFEPHYIEVAAAVRDPNSGQVVVVYPNTTVGWVRRQYGRNLPLRRTR